MANQSPAKNKKSPDKSGRIVLIVLILVVALLTAASFLWNRLSGQKISNPAGTVGNTAGNLNNGGLFCEYNDTVYFSNPFDGGALYSMSVNEEDIRFLSNSVAHTILAGGDHLYYFQSGVAGEGDISNVVSAHGFNRADLNGRHAVPLTNDVIVSGQLVDDYLYLMGANKQGVDFFKLKVDRSDRVSLASYVINPSCADNGLIYYNDVNNGHSLYALNTANDVPHKILDAAVWNPVLIGSYVYYMDVSHNYRLCRYNFSTEETDVLTRDRVDCFNVGSGYIYYQKNGAEPQLICMRTDGTDAMIIAEGIYTHIHMTSRYVYFQDYESHALYHSPIGSSSYSLFQDAMNAVPAKKK